MPWLRRALTPLLVASQTLPIVAIAPLMIIWFGFGLLPKVVVIALVTFFPIAIGLIEGFAATDRQATNLLRSMGASRLDQFRYVRLPGAMPSFFTALRIGITYAVTGAIFAEYVGATAGLGIFMQVQKNSFRTDLVLAAVVVTAAVSVTLFALTYLVQRVRGAVEQAMKLRVDAVTKGYPGLAVLDDVAFDVAPGEFVSVIGPSGCGKSTLFDVIAGLERPDAGRVLVDGADATGHVEHAAYMPQRDLLFPWRTRAGQHHARAGGGGGAAAGGAGAGAAAVRAVRARRVRGRPTRRASGGMRQRAALLRTVVQERSLLLLDEPFGALDSLTRSEMQAWLAGVWAQLRLDGAAGDPRHPRGRVPVRPGGRADPAARDRAHAGERRPAAAADHGRSR